MGDVCSPKPVVCEPCPRLPKPAGMRNMLFRRLIHGLVAGFVFTTGVCTVWKVYHMDYRQRKTKEYFETYDPVWHFERIRDLGLLQWAKPKPGAKPVYEIYKLDTTPE